MDCCHRLWCWVKPFSIALLGSDAGFRRRARCDERCGRDGPEWRRRRSDRRISQNATILDRMVSEVTVTDPRHFLSGHRLAVLDERSGRGPSYVVVELADGGKRSVRIAATDLVPPGNSSSAAEPSLPRISVRTLIPLARHLNRILTLLTEEVIRDEPASPSASSRCVSTVDPGRQDQPGSGGSSVSVAEPVARDSNANSPNIGGAVAADAAEGCGAGRVDGPC